MGEPLNLTLEVNPHLGVVTFQYIDIGTIKGMKI